MNTIKLIENLFSSINWTKYKYLLLFSTLLHLLFIFMYSTDIGIDGYIYQRIADKIILTTGPLYCGAFEGAYWPPLFPFYIATFISLLGDSQYLFFIGNLLIALSTTLISVRYLQKLFNQKIAFWGTLFYFNSMMMFKFVHYYKYELISGLLLSISLYLLIRGEKKYDIGISGMFLSLAILANGRLIALIPPILYFLYKKYNRHTNENLKKIVIFLGVVLITILPWTLRNYICFDKLVFLSTNSGINIYMGFNPNATGGFVSQDKFVEPYNKIDRTDHITYTKAAIDFIVSNPGESALLVLKKINKLWRIHYADSVLFYPFFYLGIFILIKIFTTHKYIEARFIQLIFLFFTMFHLFFIARFYYLLPIAPLLYVTAIATQSYLWQKYVSPKLMVE